MSAPDPVHLPIARVPKGAARRPRGRRPDTPAGRWAVGLTVFAALVMLLGLFAGDLADRGFGPAWGINLSPLAIPAGLAGAGCAIAALRRGDRALLVWLALVPAVLISLFWVAFVIAELVSPHD